MNQLVKIYLLDTIVKKTPLTQKRNTLLLFFLTLALNQSVWAEQPNGQTILPGESDVLPGPFEQERKLLLRRIKASEEQGIGIRSYLVAFERLEKSVKAGFQSEKIKIRLSLLNDALTKQLKLLKKQTTPIKLQSQENINTLLTLQDSRRYMLSLINQERAKYNLAPVLPDSTALVAAQQHSDDMAANYYCSHWDTQGKKPWQRYSDVGGQHNVGENCSLRFVQFQKEGFFPPEVLRSIHLSLMNHEGHRQQILNPNHNKIGLGISCSETKNSYWGFALALVELFVDDYGEYLKLPKAVRRDQPIDVSGSLRKGLILDSVSVYREMKPVPMSVSELKMTSTCRLDASFVTEFYPTLESGKIKTWTTDDRSYFTLEIVPEENWLEGLYYLKLWAINIRTKNRLLVSTRTFLIN